MVTRDKNSGTAMDKNQDTILNGLREAIRTETDGHHFYLMAAKTVGDPKGRAVFSSLAEDELAHLQFLSKQHDAISATGKVDPNIMLGKPSAISHSDPIFSDEIRMRINAAHFEMSALSIGIQLEINSESHYRRLAESVRHAELKKFYLELAEWESGHYQRLLHQQNSLKEDYWSSGGFTPF